jgi:hypothetical protein
MRKYKLEGSFALRRGKFGSKMGGCALDWLAGRLLMLLLLGVSACVYGYYECVDVGPVAPRCCCCCRRRKMEAVRGKMRANKNQTRRAKPDRWSQV